MITQNEKNFEKFKKFLIEQGFEKSDNSFTGLSNNSDVYEYKIRLNINNSTKIYEIIGIDITIQTSGHITIDLVSFDIDLDKCKFLIDNHKDINKNSVMYESINQVYNGKLLNIVVMKSIFNATVGDIMSGKIKTIIQFLKQMFPDMDEDTCRLLEPKSFIDFMNENFKYRDEFIQPYQVSTKISNILH